MVNLILTSQKQSAEAVLEALEEIKNFLKSWKSRAFLAFLERFF